MEKVSPVVRDIEANYDFTGDRVVLPKDRGYGIVRRPIVNKGVHSDSVFFV